MQEQELGDDIAEIKNRVQKIRSAAVQPITSGVQKEAHPLQSPQNQNSQQEVQLSAHLLNRAQQNQGRPTPPQLPPGILGLLNRMPQPQLLEPHSPPQPQLPTATVSSTGLITPATPVPPAAIPLQQQPSTLIDIFSERFNKGNIASVKPMDTSNLGNPSQKQSDPLSADQQANPHVPQGHKGREHPAQRFNDNTD
ncbi:MAG: hypothetical protein M1503_06405 [Thaumarchaeota archaeon]|nr:hypothetical protein [Nitrososphaerota archaeon]MCL5317875.1 hypothetical protein [Nitrososphaerota archaeon]